MCNGFTRASGDPPASNQLPSRFLQKSLYSLSGSINISFVPSINSDKVICFTAALLPLPGTPIITKLEFVRSFSRSQKSSTTSPPVASFAT